MPNSDTSSRGRGRGSGGRLDVRRRLRDCQGDQFQINISASDANNRYSLNERCRPMGPAAARGGPAAGPGANASERQQIIAELAALGASTGPGESYASDYKRREPHLNDAAFCKFTAATYACILDGVSFMKRNKTTQPNVHARLNAFILQWNDRHLTAWPVENKKELKIRILQFIIT